jgi:hypothetical protein
MFFCQEKKQRRKAQKIIDEGALLEALLWFRTGHKAQQPNLGHLILPAMLSPSARILESPVLHKDVYLSTLTRRSESGRWACLSSPRTTMEAGDERMLM